MEDHLADLIAQRAYLLQWLEMNSTQQKAVPYVQRRLQELGWEIDALSNRPEEAEEIHLDFDAGAIDTLKGVLPPLPRIDLDSMARFSAMNSSGSASVFGFVARVGDINTPDAQKYSETHVKRYQEIQQSNNRLAEVRRMIEHLNEPVLLDRFDRASKAYSALNAGTMSRSAAASEMRTLLLGILGFLPERAKSYRNENMTWQEMARRKVNGPPGGREEQELIASEGKFNQLISRLSAVLKDMRSGSLTNLNDIWTEILDRVYVVLGLIKL